MAPTSTLSYVMPFVVNTELGRRPGGGARLQDLEPADVADAIVDALQHGTVEVWVPKSTKRPDRLGTLLPRRAGEGIGRAMKADRCWPTPTHGARAAYELRAPRPSRGCSRRPSRRRSPSASRLAAASSHSAISPTDQRARVLLQKMTRRSRSRVGAGRPIAAAKRSPTVSGRIGSESAHSISVGRAVLAQRVQHALTPCAPGASGVSGISSGNARAPALEATFGIGRVVGGDHLVARVVLARAAHEEADRQILGALDEVAEREPRVGHPLVAGEQARVEDHDARRSAPGARPPGAVRSGRPSRERRSSRRAGRAPRAASRRSRRGGRRSTSRCPSACPSARSRGGPARCSESPRRAPVGITLRHRNDHVGSPCMKITGAPSPSSRCARRRPSTLAVVRRRTGSRAVPPAPPRVCARRRSFRLAAYPRVHRLGSR